MVATVDISRIYLNEDGPSVITCRHCDVQHPMHMSQYLRESIGRELVQIKCKSLSGNKVYERQQLMLHPGQD